MHVLRLQIEVIINFVEHCHIKLRSLQRPRHVDMYSVIFLMPGSDSGGIADTQPDAINGSHQRRTSSPNSPYATVLFPPTSPSSFFLVQINDYVCGNV